MKKWLYILPVIFFVSCTSHPAPLVEIPANWKQLDLKEFKISTPSQWKYEDPGEQEDSFVGHIEISKSADLFFDCSDMGYASHLLPTMDEYLKNTDRYREFSTTINTHHIVADSDRYYVYKTIWPKIAGKGMTGIYIHSRNSSFNFQMNGKNLSAKDQALALQAFKTIKFPEK